MTGAKRNFGVGDQDETSTMNTHHK